MNAVSQQLEVIAPDYQAIKSKQQHVWGSGDYAKVGSTVQITGENLAESMNLSAGQSLLDVAAGNGNFTLAAARRFCKVVSTDYVETLLESGKRRADANGFAVDFQFADAEDLPFADNSFDNVASTFGVMFAPNQPKCAAEMIRVCRAGGKIGLANWTPESFIGQLFKVIGKHVAPPAGLSSPAQWGTESFIQQNFANSASDIQFRVRNYNFRYESVQHWLDVFRTYYGPIHKAFEALGTEQGKVLEEQILSLATEFNEAQDGSMCVPSSYAEIVVTL